MDRRLPIAVVICAALAAAPCGAQPRFQLSADTVLIDESVGIALVGLPPGAW